MPDPYEIRKDQVETGAATAPTPATVPPGATVPPAAYNPPGATYAGQRAVATRTSMMPVGYRARQFIWLAVAVVDLILALRFVFIAAGANPSAGFVSVIDRMGSSLAYPFQGIFGNTSVDGHPLLWACILAIAIYTVVAWIVVRLVVITAARNPRAPIAY